MWLEVGKYIGTEVGAARRALPTVDMRLTEAIRLEWERMMSHRVLCHEFRPAYHKPRGVKEGRNESRAGTWSALHFGTEILVRMT